MIALIVLIYITLVYILLSKGISNGYQIDSDEKKKKRNAAGTGTKGPVHKVKVDATKSVDARPRKTSGTIRSEKVVPWK